MKYIIILLFAIFSTVANAKVNTYGDRSEIPEDARPNQETLEYYLDRYLNELAMNNVHVVVERDDYHTLWFRNDNGVDKNVTKEMDKKNSGLLSYLKYENGKITVDQKNEKFDFTNEDQYISQSVGKTIISYVTGHAICQGYIDGGINHLVTMPMIENTLYNNQKLIDLLNMRAGDQKYVTKRGFKNYKRWVNHITMEETMTKVMDGSVASKPKYNYNNIVPNLVFTYVAYKTGDEFEEFLESLFVNKIGIENDVWFAKQDEATEEDLSYWYHFYATRYDYLRIANAMLSDWQNNTCEGKYLKSLYKNKQWKNEGQGKNDTAFNNPKAYAGQFHTSYSGMKNRHVMGWDGYGGQVTLIDFDNGRIVSTMAVHRNYNWKKIIHKVIKNGN